MKESGGDQMPESVRLTPDEIKECTPKLITRFVDALMLTEEFTKSAAYVFLRGDRVVDFKKGDDNFYLGPPSCVINSLPGSSTPAADDSLTLAVHYDNRNKTRNKTILTIEIVTLHVEKGSGPCDIKGASIVYFKGLRQLNEDGHLDPTQQDYDRDIKETNTHSAVEGAERILKRLQHRPFFHKN